MLTVSFFKKNKQTKNHKTCLILYTDFRHLESKIRRSWSILPVYIEQWKKKKKQAEQKLFPFIVVGCLFI